MQMGNRGTLKLIVKNLMLAFTLVSIECRADFFINEIKIENFKISNSVCTEEKIYCDTLEYKHFSTSELNFIDQSFKNLMALGLANFLEDIRSKGFFNF